MTSPEAAVVVQEASQFRAPKIASAITQRSEVGNEWPARFKANPAEAVIMPFRQGNPDNGSGQANLKIETDTDKPNKRFQFEADRKFSMFLSEVVQNTFDSVSGIKGTPPDALYKGRIREYAKSKREAAKVLEAK